MLYLSFYPQGLKNIMTDVLKFYIKDAQVIYSNDTAISYRTNLNWNEISRLECFESSFLVIRLVKDIDKKALKNLYNWAMSNRIFYQKIKNFIKGGYSFRIVDSGIEHDKNMFAKERKNLESSLFSYGVRIDKAHPDFEIRFIEKYQFSFIGIRISKPPQYRGEKQKGSLRKEILSAMLHLSQPDANDIFLDPFCGSGVIPVKRAKLFPYKEIIATDKFIGKVKKRIRSNNLELKNFTIKESNYTQLGIHYKHKVGKIVTDPPWGLIEDIPDIHKFYDDMFKQFKEVLTLNGIIVLITNRNQIVSDIIKNDREYHLLRRIKVKVSGLTSYIFKMKFSPINI